MVALHASYLHCAQAHLIETVDMLISNITGFHFGNFAKLVISAQAPVGSTSSSARTVYSCALTRYTDAIPDSEAFKDACTIPFATYNVEEVVQVLRMENSKMAFPVGDNTTLDLPIAIVAALPRLALMTPKMVNVFSILSTDPQELDMAKYESARTAIGELVNMLPNSSRNADAKALYDSIYAKLEILDKKVVDVAMEWVNNLVPRVVHTIEALDLDSKVGSVS